jgi:citrate/tricarballylate utilization protein
MAGLFGGVFVYAIVAMIAGVVRFWNATGPAGSLSAASLWRAMKGAATLRQLEGGGMGCMNESERPSGRRRLYHHLTFYGFLLCFASTLSGTLAHYVFDWPAPYPWWSPSVVFGTIGGIGLVVGPLGLMAVRSGRDPAIRGSGDAGMGAAFLWMLLLVSVTGLALLVLRATPAMGLLLALHLGFVFALFLSMPYGKFVHGIYRYAALVRHAHESEGG